MENKKLVLYLSLISLILFIVINGTYHKIIKKEVKTNVNEILKNYDIQTGDLILIQNTETVSKVIRGYSNNYDYSHLGMVVDFNNELRVLEVEAEKFFGRGSVRFRKIFDSIKNADKIAIYRLKIPFNKEQLTNDTYYYYKYKDSFYFDWLLSLKNNSVYCVELIDKLFKKQNINIVKKETLRMRNDQQLILPVDVDLSKYNLIVESTI